MQSSGIIGPLFVERVGHGPPMVLLHPLPCDRRSWIFQQARFSTWFQTLAIDLPGFGRSPAARGPFTMRDMAIACWEAVDTSRSDAPIIVGLSAGSTVAQFMAAERPDRVAALVVTGGGWFPLTDTRFHRNISAAIERYEAEGIAAREAALEHNYGPAFAGTALARYFTRLMVDADATADLPTVIAVYRTLQTPVPDGLHSRITAPTLIISGSADPAVNAHRILAERIRRSELRVMEGAGHLCNVERPWEYDALVQQFLRSHGLLLESTRS